MEYCWRLGSHAERKETVMVGAAPLLENLLEQVLTECGREAALESERSLRDLCRPSVTPGVGDLDGAADRLRSVPTQTIREVVQILTMRFHLRNKAEQLEIASINRDRERRATSETPRAESIAEAVARLAESGGTLESIAATLEKLEIAPTLTAHPTEARRRAVLRKQGILAASLDRLEDPRLTPTEQASETDALKRTLVELTMTDEVRTERLDAMDEVRNGLHFLTGTIWGVAPRLYLDLDRAVRSTFGVDAKLDAPTMLRYRSWIGGDRDGNPRVTAEVTRSAIKAHREAAIELYLEALETLRQHLSVSDRRRPPSQALLDAIEAGGDIDEDRHTRHEPYRRRIAQIADLVAASLHRPEVYDCQRFVADLELLADSLRGSGLSRLADGGPLRALLVRARTFGFNLAALDLRQHSEVLGAAVAELLQAAGVCDNYVALDEAARLELLRAELRTSRPLTPHGAEFSEATASVLDTFRVARDAIEHEPRSIGTFIVSMTHEISHVLEPLLLAREFGL
ncbi:MAG: phosphoenolpyruvate carboxylase, partial [Planctomycetota bacterium]